MGGIQLSSTGQVYVTAAPAVSDTYDNGFRVSALGQLVITPGGVVATFEEGIPRDSNGAVVTLANGTPVALPDGSYAMLGGLSIANTGLYTTDATPSVLAPPENTVAPDVTGTNTVGSTLTCSTGTWTNSPSAYAYQWFQNNTPLIGQTLNTHVITAGDVGSELVCRVTATNVVGGGQAFSNGVRIGGARYNYTTSSEQNPTTGNIVNNTGSLIVRLNTVDLDGVNHYDSLVQLKAGDTVVIGVTSGVLANEVNFNGATAQLYMVSWAGPANGEYVVTVILA